MSNLIEIGVSVCKCIKKKQIHGSDTEGGAKTEDVWEQGVETICIIIRNNRRREKITKLRAS
jgi:hypothetical protein